MGWFGLPATSTRSDSAGYVSKSTLSIACILWHWHCIMTEGKFGVQQIMNTPDAAENRLESQRLFAE
jgi:hypothetical protein